MEDGAMGGHNILASARLVVMLISRTDGQIRGVP
jgi:hypothetical protein